MTPTSVPVAKYIALLCAISSFSVHLATLLRVGTPSAWQRHITSTRLAAELQHAVDVASNPSLHPPDDLDAAIQALGTVGKRSPFREAAINNITSHLHLQGSLYVDQHPWATQANVDAVIVQSLHSYEVPPILRPSHVNYADLYVCAGNATPPSSPSTQGLWGFYSHGLGGGSSSSESLESDGNANADDTRMPSTASSSSQQATTSANLGAWSFGACGLGTSNVSDNSCSDDSSNCEGVGDRSDTSNSDSHTNAAHATSKQSALQHKPISEEFITGSCNALLTEPNSGITIPCPCNSFRCMHMHAHAPLLLLMQDFVVANGKLMHSVTSCALVAIAWHATTQGATQIAPIH